MSIAHKIPAMASSAIIPRPPRSLRSQSPTGPILLMSKARKSKKPIISTNHSWGAMAFVLK